MKKPRTVSRRNDGKNTASTIIRQAIKGTLKLAPQDESAQGTPPKPCVAPDLEGLEEETFAVVDLNNVPKGLTVRPGISLMGAVTKNGVPVVDVMAQHLTRYYESVSDVCEAAIGTQCLNILGLASEEAAGMSPEVRANWAGYHLGRIAHRFNDERLSSKTRKMLEEIERASRRIIYSEEFFDNAGPDMQRELASMLRMVILPSTKASPI